MSIEVSNNTYILNDACGWSWSWRWSGGFGTWSMGTSALWGLQEAKLQKVQLIHSLGQDRGEWWGIHPSASEKGVMPPKQQKSKAFPESEDIIDIDPLWIMGPKIHMRYPPHSSTQFKVLRHDLHVSLWCCPWKREGWQVNPLKSHGFHFAPRHSSRFSGYQ